jgi:hypothetical protein
VKLLVKKATTDVTVYVFIQNSSVATGAGLTGLVFNSAGLVCYQVRPLAAAAALTLATQTVTGAHSDGGFVEVDATNMPGVYRLDLSDAICATGVNSVVVMLKGATNMAPVLLEIQLVSFDPNDSVAIGMTLVPANVTQLGGVAQSLTDLKDFADDGYDPSTNKVQGVVLVDTLTTYTGNTLQTGDSFPRLGAPAGASVSADIAAVKAETASIQSDTNDIQTRLPAALVSGRMDSSVGAMAANTLTASALATDAREEIADQVWDEAIAGHLGAGSTGLALNSAGAAGDPWATALPGAYGAGTAGKIVGDNVNATISSRASQTSVDTIDDFLDTEIAAILVAVDTEIAAIKAKTDQLIFTQANRVDAQVAGADANTITASALAADAVTEIQAGLATAAAIATLQALVDDLETRLSAARALLLDNLSFLTVAPPTANQNADAILDRADGIETGVTLRQAQRLALAANAGKLSGAATTTVRIRDRADSKDRIVATVDADGNRTAVTVDTT